MLAEIPIGFWAFWLALGLVLYIAFVWTMVRLAVRSDERSHEERPGSEDAPKARTDDTEGSHA